MGITVDETAESERGPATGHGGGAGPALSVGRTPWVRATVVGHLVIAGALAVATVGAVAAGAFAMPIAVVFPVVIGVGLVGAWLASRGTRAGLAIAIVLAVLVVGANLEFIAAGVTTPASFWDFVPNLGALVGGLLAVIGGILALRHRSQAPVALTGPERRVVQSALAFLAVATIGSAALAATSATTVSAAQREGAVEVEAVDTAYAPDVLDVDAGARVVVDNIGNYTHTFTIPELGIDLEVLPGSSAIATLPDQVDAGSWQFHCTPHSTGDDGARTGMVGTLEVRS
ncbi:MAG TPA: cupredoxin domain-containing protein [Nitriliruptoraceae bacterium]|nr:cupredoxin domain-containing protein [Nitriliruptoraceae bacterium]